MSDCLFCRIVEGDVPADIVLRTDRVVAFRDIKPQAPVHVLVIPTSHHANAGELLAAAAQVAEAEGLSGGYRIVLNTGADAGQTVFHVHAHVLGGRDLLWPPG